jgi:O-antigen/teichoic acid export membrane protein
MAKKESSDSKRIIKGVSLSWLKFFLTMMIGIVQTPLLFKYLPTVELNTWYVFFSFGAFLQISDLGLVASISRIIAYLDNSDPDKPEEKTTAGLKGFSTHQIYSTSLFSFSSILFLFGAVACGSYILLHRSDDSSLNLAFIIFISGIVFNLIANIPTAVLDGYRDVGYDSLVRCIVQVVYFLALFFLLPVFKSILFVSFAFLGQNLLQFLTLHFILRFRHKATFAGPRSLKHLIQLTIVKNVYGQSFPLAINQLGTWLTSQGSVLIASIVLGQNKLSDYVINQQLFSYGISISLVINQIIGPFVAKQYIQDKKENLIAYYKNTVILSLCIVGLFLVALFTSCSDIIDLWVGPGHFLGYNFAVVFALITFFEVQHSVAGNFVWNMGVWPFNKWTLAAGIINIGLGFVLGTYFGLFGIAFATFISKVLTLNWYVVFYCLKKLKLGIVNYLGTVFIPMVLAVVVTICLVFFMKSRVHLAISNDLVFIMLLSTISALIFSGLIILLFRKAFAPVLLMMKK